MNHKKFPNLIKIPVLHHSLKSKVFFSSGNFLSILSHSKDPMNRYTSHTHTFKLCYIVSVTVLLVSKH